MHCPDAGAVDQKAPVAAPEILSQLLCKMIQTAVEFQQFFVQMQLKSMPASHSFKVKDAVHGNMPHSVENLYGMGDHAATQENYALFDYLEYVPYDYSMKPIIEGQLPPEPEGTTVKWDFEEAGFVPVGWTNNGGTIADGSLNLSNGNNFVYSPEVGAGKYTWEIDVPLVGVGEKWLAGGNIAATNAEERSFSMFVFSGTENDRAACTVPPVPGQMLVRCYTEAMGVYGVPIDPGKHTLTIDLRLNADGAYWAAWIIDGEVAKTFTTWYTPAQFKFGFSMMTFADGGGWQGDKPTAKTYTVKYDYIEYKKYNYDEE